MIKKNSIRTHKSVASKAGKALKDSSKSKALKSIIASALANRRKK